MALFSDWSVASDAKDIMERFLKHLPEVFPGFDVEKIHFILTKKKKSKTPVKVRAVGYPNYVFGGKPYICEVFDLWWQDMDAKRKNLAVFHAMCAIPEGGFDEQSNNYGKLKQPDIKMFMLEYAACGGVPNWMENPAAKDPMERDAEDIAKDEPVAEVIPGEAIKRTPLTAGDVADMGEEDEVG
jgi:hypothetical protein